MPSSFSDFQERHIAALIDLTIKEYGQPISTKIDCDKLTELIENRTRKVVSVNTLRRFFDVMPSSGKPSLETLNILATFCGYADFYDFKHSLNETDKAANTDLTTDAVNDLYQAFRETPQFYTTLSWLIKYAFRDGNIAFLKSFFDLDVFRGKFDYTQGDFKKPLMSFGLELQSSPKMFDMLVNHYVNNPVAQALYFECFVDYDFLTIRHHHAIRAYLQSRKDNEAQLFSLCILFLHSFLLKDRVACSELIKRINAIDFSVELHPFPAGRKMACNILFQSFFMGYVKLSLINEIFEVEQAMPREGVLGRNIPSYHTMVAEAFVWSGLHHQAVSIIELALGAYKTESNYHTQGILNNLWVTYSDALLKSSRIEECREVYNKVETSHFDVHSKRFGLMHYYKIGSEIQKQGNPKLAASLKRSSLEIAANHKFKFFQTLYS
jgi:hypothetical protein